MIIINDILDSPSKILNKADVSTVTSNSLLILTMLLARKNIKNHKFGKDRNMTIHRGQDVHVVNSKNSTAANTHY